MEPETGMGNGITLRVVLPGFSSVPALFPVPCVVRNMGAGGLAGGVVRESKSKCEMSFGLTYPKWRENAESTACMLLSVNISHKWNEV